VTPDRRFEICGRNQIDSCGKEVGELLLDATKPDEAHALRECDEEVHVTRWRLLATRDAAEDAQHPHPVPGGSFEHSCPLLEQPPSHVPSEALAWGTRTNLDRQIATGGLDQPYEHRERRLTTTGLVDADHALAHT
jgi:hypothetical protein